MTRAEDIVRMARDAARWRWWRECAPDSYTPEEMDAYVDAELDEADAMKQVAA